MFSIVALLFFSFLCAGAKQTVDRVRKQPCKSENIIQANRLFAFDLFHQIARSNSDGNIFIAPLVVDMGLSMALEGADGRTRRELETVLRLGSLVDSSKDDLGCVYKRFNVETEPKLTTAVRMYGEKTLNFKTQFRSDTTRYAGNKLQEVDFVNEPENVRSKINGWVSQKTAGRIEELFPGGSINRMTKLALASVLYFKGQWVTPFKQNISTVFYGTTFAEYSPVNMMTGKIDVKYFYEQQHDVFFVELPYRSEEVGVDISMILILDQNRPGFANAERLLNETVIEPAITRLLETKPRNVEVLLPIFDLRASYDLIETLQGMGINSLFTPEADLSGMTDSPQNFYVDTAVHKTFLAIDKQGTEAAGAFGLGFETLSLPFQLRFDKPFHLLIYEKNARSILFMGRIVNPNL